MEHYTRQSLSDLTPDWSRQDIPAATTGRDRGTMLHMLGSTPLPSRIARLLGWVITMALPLAAEGESFAQQELTRRRVTGLTFHPSKSAWMRASGVPIFWVSPITCRASATDTTHPSTQCM